MKVIITYLIIVFSAFGCYSQGESKNDNLNSVQNNYEPIRDGLCKDNKGNVYFKALDASNRNKLVDRFIYVVYSNEFGVDGIKEMKDVVDSESFKSMGSYYYQDKNHIYYFHVMSDGGTMSIIDEANHKTFKVFKHSMYGVDSQSAFYRGAKIAGVDISTFEPIIIESEGQKIGWHAKDKNSYYNGYNVMSETEISELKEEIKRLTTKPKLH